MFGPRGNKDRWIAPAFWLAYAVAQLAGHRGAPGPVSGNDDMARLVQVRQWMAGQGWWDLTQYRLNPPTGVAMHWTRHTDVLVAGLVTVAGGPGPGAERFAGIALPLLLALGAYIVVAGLAREMGGRSAVPAALLLLLASVLTAQQYAPGRIDHHGLQVVLLLVATLGLLRLERPRWALTSGIAAGLSLSVGLEQLAVVGGVIAAVGIVGALGDETGPGLRRFAGGLVGGSILGSLVFAPPSRIISVVCDVFSLPHLVAVGVAGATLAVMHRFRYRLAVLVTGGLVAAGGALAIAPRCVDPYADVDPLLQRLWLSNVAEVQGIGSMLAEDPGSAWAVLVPGLVALGHAVVRWRVAGWGTGRWFRLTLVMAVAYGVALFQFRGASVATALSVAVLGVLFAGVRDRLAAWPMLGRVGVMLVVALVVSGLGPLLVGVALDDEQDSTAGGVDCGTATAGLEIEGLVLAPIDLGPDLLVGTDAGVLAAPYHRNNAGNRLAWDLLLGAPEDAEFSQHGIDWVVTCEGMNENDIFLARSPSGLMAALLAGNPPASLERTELGADGLTVYRVRS